ncbi:uncharacterized protein [Oryza sativa Japonica Group]|uniref:uncharacterized protein n=1 Tax=Oryza sativa subsp. japonica TaxID=39947 RepID=UPI00077546AF|nr:uncharacterized protein LOC107277773 [Oryza sativa Japonica Group]KAF2944467.1 hypothetical protein DAI22_02g144800 [Oryza sativa Japonica Group]
MGHCISMLRKMTRRRQPEPTRGTPKPPLFVVRGDRRPPLRSKPEALPFQAQSFGQLQFAQKPAAGRADSSRSGHETKFRHEVDPGVLDRRRCAPKLVRLPCRSTCSTSAVEPVTAEERPLAPSATKAPPQEGSRTPMVAPPMTPMRPVWQRRILMGMRCELPRFSGLILYDEHGRPIRGTTPGRSYPQWKKRNAKAATTLRDLL